MKNESEAAGLERAFYQFSAIPDYMAHALVLTFGRATRVEDIAKSLGCSDEQVIQLGFCKSPDLSSPDLDGQLKSISDYVGIELEIVESVIRSSSVLSKMQGTSATQEMPPALMAARPIYSSQDELEDDPK